MPYEMRANCIYKKGDSKPLKCYDNHADALAYMRALEANVSEAKEQDQKAIRYSQAEANYRELSDVAGKACANCRWFIAWDSYCHVIEGGPKDILVTGLSDKWEAKPEPPEPEPIPVVIIEPAIVTTDTGEMKTIDIPLVKPSIPERKSLIDPVAEWIKSHLLPIFRLEDKPSAGFKAIPGRNVWLSWWTTTTKDLEGESFASQAIDDFIDRVDKGLTPYPELWFGHMPIRHGQVKWLGRIGQIAIAAGTFDDTPIAQKLVAWYRKQTKEIPVSHGFKYIKALKREGVYYHFDTFEISTLHPIYMKAANPTAKFSEVMNMKEISPEKLQSLTDVLGSDELAKQVAQEALSVLDKKSKELGSGEAIGAKTDNDAPVIPVIDADARKELNDLKTAQKAFETTLVETVSKAVKEAVTTATADLVTSNKALTDKLIVVDNHDTQLKEMAASIKTLTERVDGALQLHAPASTSVLSQILAGSKAFDDATALQQKNDAPAQKSIVEQMLNGAPLIGAQ